MIGPRRQLELRSELIDPLQDERWLQLASEAPAATVFHHPAWLEHLARSYRYQPLACVLTDGEGRLRAGLPLMRVRSLITGQRLVALPFSDVVPPIYATADEDEPSSELAHAIEHHATRLGLELDIHAQIELPAETSAGDRFWHHVLSLRGSFEDLERGFSSAQRRGVRKARKEAVQIRRLTERQGLEAFFRLHVQTRRFQGVPTQPRKFILGFEHLFRQDLGFVLLAEVDQQPIAAAVFLSWNGTLVYKYGASDRASLGKRPNNLLFAEAIRDAAASGLHSLDLGRTDLGNDGLRAFKAGWGAEEREVSYTRSGSSGATRSARGTSSLQRRVIQRMPAGFGRIVGAVLYRHFA